jgi:hypothetical protein
MSVAGLALKDFRAAYVQACETGNVDLVRQLRAENKQHWHAFDTSLFESASKHGHVCLLDMAAAEEDARWHLRHDHRLKLCAIDACWYGHLHVLQWLAALGVNVHCHADTAFQRAVHRGHVHIAQWLVQREPAYPWPAASLCRLMWTAARDTWIRSVVRRPQRRPRHSE